MRDKICDKLYFKVNLLDHKINNLMITQDALSRELESNLTSKIIEGGFPSNFKLCYHESKIGFGSYVYLVSSDIEWNINVSKLLKNYMFNYLELDDIGLRVITDSNDKVKLRVKKIRLLVNFLVESGIKLSFELNMFDKHELYFNDYKKIKNESFDSLTGTNIREKSIQKRLIFNKLNNHRIYINLFFSYIEKVELHD